MAQQATTQVPQAEPEKTGTVLTPLSGFGLETKVKHNIQHLDQNRILFPIGRHVASFDLESREMSFIMEVDKVNRIQAMAVSPNKKYLALIETVHDSETPQFSIFNLHTDRRVRSLMIGADISKTQHLITLAFSGCCKYLIVQCGEPDWLLSVWRWYNGKMTCFTRVEVEVDHVSFNPMDLTTIVATGAKLMRLFKMDKDAEGLRGTNLSPGRRDVGTYTDHTWLAGSQLAVSCDSGSILIFDHTDLKGVVPPATADTYSIVAITTMSRGFIAATSTKEFLIYEVASRPSAGENQAEPAAVSGGGGYNLAKRFAIELGPAWLSMSPTEEQLVCTSGDGNIGTVTFSNLEEGSTESPFELLCMGFHRGAITGMDVCATRPLVVTSGEDRTVRIWNYLDKMCRIRKQFIDDITSVAFHPSSFYVLVGMVDKLRLFYVTSEDLLQVREFHISACRVVKFSNGGHLIAAANKAVIQIYNMTSSAAQQIGTLKGHSAPVRSLCWSNNDARLASAGVGGEVYEWQIDTMTRDHNKESVQKGCQYTSVSYSANGEAIVATGSDGKIKHLVGGNVEFEVSTGHGMTISEIMMGRDDRMLVAGTELGGVRTYNWITDPTLASATDGLFHEYRLHASPITHIRLSGDQNFVLSACSDGTFFVCDAQMFVEGVAQEKQPVERGLDITLVTKEELDETHQALSELNAKLRSVQSENLYGRMLRDNEWKEQVARVTEERDEARSAVTANAEELKKVKTQVAQEAEQQVSTLEAAHAQAAEELENLYEKKLEMESRRYQLLKEKADDERFAAEERIRVMQEAHEAALRQLQTEFEARLQEEMTSLSLEKKARDTDKREADEILTQAEVDYDIDTERIKEDSQKQMMNMRQFSQRLKADNALLMRNNERLKKQLTEESAALAKKENEKEILRLEMKDMDSLIGELQKEVKERNSLIESKETVISDTKMRVKDLEKQKFVLDYKVNSLKAEMEPREEKLQDLQKLLKNMDTDLQGQMTTLTRQKQAVEEKDERIGGLKDEVRQLRQAVTERDIYIKGFSHDLNRVMDLPHGRREGQREEALKFLHRVYVLGQEKPAPVEETVQEELTRQRDFLEKKNKYLQRKASLAEHSRTGETRHARLQNTQLLQEINMLRRENKELQVQVKSTKERLSLVQYESRAAEAGGPGSPGGSLRGAEAPGLPDHFQAMAGLHSAVNQALEGLAPPPISRPATAGNSRPSTARSGFGAGWGQPGPRPESGTTRGRGGAMAGSLVRGSSGRAIRELVSMERDKVMELVSQLEHQHLQMEDQQAEIERLKDAMRYFDASGGQGGFQGIQEGQEGADEPRDAPGEPRRQRPATATEANRVAASAIGGSMLPSNSPSARQRPASAVPGSQSRGGSRMRPGSAAPLRDTAPPVVRQ